MKFFAISCEVFARECDRAAAISPHDVTISLQPFGLHSQPDDLRAGIQEEIDKASGGKFDYILLAYGLCSRGTADLVIHDTPIVIPRAHDCITLLLGSRERYRQEFEAHPGTYYYSSGWIERREGEVNQGMIVIVSDQEAEDRFREYVEKFGEDNAQYLIEQERLWLSHYDRAVFLDTGLGDKEYYRRFTRQVAESHGWFYEEIPGDTRLIDRLLGGVWDEKEFLIVQPGQRTVEDINAGIILAVDG